MGFRTTLTSLDGVTLTNAVVTGELHTASDGPRIVVRERLNGTIDEGVIEFLGDDGSVTPTITGTPAGVGYGSILLDNDAGGTVQLYNVDNATTAGKRNVFEVRADRAILPAATVLPDSSTVPFTTGNGGLINTISTPWDSAGSGFLQPTVRMLPGRMVKLSGLLNLSKSGGIAPGTKIGAIPAAFWPAEAAMLSPLLSNGAYNVRLDVGADGSLTLASWIGPNPIPAGTYLSYDQCPAFPAAPLPG